MRRASSSCSSWWRRSGVSARGAWIRSKKVAIRDRSGAILRCADLSHDGIEVTVIDLVTLMIILSDNTATNVLIDLLGFAAINTTIHRLGYSETSLLRKILRYGEIGKRHPEPHYGRRKRATCWNGCTTAKSFPSKRARRS